VLALEVSFLTGRYVATAFDDRGRAEWPPHPSRLFSALAATHFEALDPPNEERAALEWMEQLGPPQITVTGASLRKVVKVFVPVNDTSVVSSVDDEAQALANARLAMEDSASRGGKALAAAEGKVAKAEARFAEAVKKATAALSPGKEGKDGPLRAASLLR
jgi:CRISPR-associated protein Csb2